MTKAMEDTTSTIETLLEKATEYGKSSYELAKLKTLDKTSDVVSTLLANSVVWVILSSFMLFLNLGLAFWLGEILGKIYFGFFVVAVFYGILGVLIYLFMHDWIRKVVSNNFIKQMLK
ncbi:MAG: hypothetical protein PHP53_20145 [Prolixibacteraceae bacterium]|nr:hypothetical protein [Prolixibacteraceae bacterium]